MANTAILPVRRKAGLLRFPGPLPVRAIGVLAAALALAGAAHARSQDAPPADAAPVSMDRLRFEYKCYFNIPEWRGKGEETFLKKLGDQKTVYKAKQPADLAALEGLMAEALWKQKTDCEARGDADGADAMAGMILDLESQSDKVVKEYRDRADAFVVERNFAKAKKLEAAGQPAEARKAFGSIAGANDKAIGQQAVSSLVRIVRTQKNYQAVLDSNELDEIGAMLDGVLADLKGDLGAKYEGFLKGGGGYTVNADLKAVDDERRKNAGDTQDITVTWRDVAKALEGVQGKKADASLATFRLEPEGEGKLFPTNGPSAVFKKMPFKWYRGVYTVRVFLTKDEKRPFAVLSGVAMKDAPGIIEVPRQVPEGMVWVPALKAGGEALFVDRTEVTVAQVEAVAGGDETLAKVLKDSREAGEDPNLPAYFAEAANIGAYEKASGKKVPTEAQWLQAGYEGKGPAERPYPWGKEPPDSSRAYADPASQAPQPAGGRPAGAALCGAEDMVGNLCEWVRKDGQFWVIGGDRVLGHEKLAGIEGHLPAREAMPQVSDFNQMSAQQQGVYGKFKFDPEGYYLCGLRTVVPVPAR